jgi:CRISPR type III-B/RAMP module RAMP protein Cmr6
MAHPEERFTLPGTKLPPELSPTLLFYRWQRYDCFWPDSFVDERGKTQKLTPFKRDFTGFMFLERVSKEVQAVGRERYTAWHDRFSGALATLEIEPVLKATTLWRLVVGWGTNPTFETGLTLDHLLGFPFIPGSAVKGLLHRVAEQELLEAVDGAAIPPAPVALPAEPPPDLTHALLRARRVHALFGSLHLRHGRPGAPEAPYDRLAAWRDLPPAPGEEPEAWTEARRQLVRLCSDAPVGGMVTCFDAVPDQKAFEGKDGSVLKPDVLTPHEPDPKPILFLAVQPGVTFELRYRLARWPVAEPRDAEERERVADLGGITREAVAQELRRWLVRGLAELGLGGKTSAGYGYLLAEGVRLPMPRLLAEPPLPAEPKEILPEPERLAREALYKDIAADPAIAALDKALKEADPAVQRAVAARFKKLFPEKLEKWRANQSRATRRRVEAIDRLLGGNGESEP